MFGGYLLFEQVAVERLRFPAFFTLDQRPPDCIDLEPVGLTTNHQPGGWGLFTLSKRGLVATVQIADIFAFAGEGIAIVPRLDPFVFLLGDGDGFAGSPHLGLQRVYEKIMPLMQYG